MRLPSLNMLKVFETAARHQSLARAADELCVTHGAVSRQIGQLEQALGFLLFERRNRAVFLTRKGEELYQACRRALSALDETIARLQAESAPQALTLSCEPTLAMRWLIPRLPAFQQAHPDIELHLLAAGGPVDFARSRVDLALRRNDFSLHGLNAYPVAREWVGPVHAPAWRERWPDLSAGELLHTRSRPDAWPRWLSGRALALDAGGASRFEHFYLSLQAAGAGLGAAIASVYMAADELAAGRLLAPCGFAEDGSEYCLLSPAPIETDSPAHRLLAWLQEQMAATAADLGIAR